MTADGGGLIAGEPMIRLGFDDGATRRAEPCILPGKTMHHVRTSRKAFRGFLPWICLIGLTSASAQQVQVQVQLGEPQFDFNPSLGLSPPNDPDAARWLKRAEDAAAEGDWKLAADTLERLIDDHGDRTVTLDEKHYYSAIELAQKQVRTWPADGVEAYRVLYDAEARRLFDRGQSERDFDALREVARKYSMTTVGPEAVELLCGWLLDARKANEALELLQLLSELPHASATRSSILEKQVIGYTLSGKRELASRTLSELRSSITSGAGDAERRAELIQRFFEDAKLNTEASRLAAIKDWRQRLGPTRRAGRMQAIEPILADTSCRARLPGAEQLNVEDARDLIKNRARPPVWQAVTDGDRLFVTCQAGLIALDAATFELLWKAFPKFRKRDREVIRHRAMMFRGGFQNDEEEETLDDLTTTALYHEYRGEVSTALGLLFLIEQPGTPGERNPTIGGAVPPNDQLDEENLAAPNSLRAYEADSGRAVWVKGRNGPPDDELKAVRFVGTPIEAAGRLVVPVLQSGDLKLAVLDAEGVVERTVLLGTGRPGLFPMNGTLQPAVRDGVIYVQTGAGMVMSLNEHDFSLRWLTAYERSSDLSQLGSHRRPWMMHGFGIAQPDGWLSSPPLIVGGVMVVAPQDSDELLAFDLYDGQERWSVSRGEHRYLVGSDGERVFVAGERVAAIDLETGQRAWQTDRIFPSGRPGISGSHVLVPRRNGLMRLQCTDGEQVGPELECDVPLGNLLAFDGALYSVGIDEVLKFPDPERSRASALARLAADPADAHAMVRLATLDTLAGEYLAALTWLDDAESTMKVAPPRFVEPGAPQTEAVDRELMDRIAHNRVRAMLALADEVTDEEQGEWLRKAQAVAVRPADRVRAGLELCEYVAEHGDVESAVMRSFALLLNVDDQPMTLGSHARVRAEVLIGERIRRFWRELPDDRKPELEARMVSEMDAASRSGSDGLRIRSADCLGFLKMAAALDLNLGRKAAESHLHETAVFYFARAARRAEDAAQKIESLARLVIALHMPGPGLPSAPGATNQRLRELEHFADHDLPPMELPSELGLLKTVSQFISAVRKDLPSGLVSAEQPVPGLLKASRLAVLRESADSDITRANGASYREDRLAHDIFTHVVPIQFERRVQGAKPSARDEEAFWFHELEMGEGEALDPISNRGIRASVYSERVAALVAPSQVVAVGLTTGRAMWAPLEIDETRGGLPDPPIVESEGIIVIASDGSSLVAVHARDDARPIWRRHWPTRRLGLLRAMGSDILVVDHDRGKASVIQAATGRVRKAYDLEQAGPAETDESLGSPTHVAVVGTVLCRSDRKSVIGRDALTGIPRWTLPVDGLVKGLFELDDAHLGVCYKANRFLVVRADNGTTIRDIAADGLVMPPIDAVVDQATADRKARVLLFTKTDDRPPEYALESFPLAGDADDSWRRDLGDSATISRAMMRESSHYVAVITNDVEPVGRTSQKRIDQRVPPELVIVDKATGYRVGRLRPFQFYSPRLGGLPDGPEAVHRSRIIHDVIVLDRRIIAVATEGFYILADKEEVMPEP